MTVNNYKVIPTKTIGKVLYYFRIILKISFYLIMIGLNVENSNYIIYIFIFYLLLEILITNIYIKFKKNIFYYFSDDKISKKYENIINKK
ncbi:hypothetical protein [Helcococcus ovis]|uniref:hypothetical protein n=1 Tax=Helcococcus ovis TaxID=72026 RepID=UPI001102D0BD|nr:hypothetical protein [Helcococcus ovis]WNZ01359.1 hypothetical protein EQF90_000470 [Helcococcus ovis]